jgi:hypothetical protein
MPASPADDGAHQRHRDDEARRNRATSRSGRDIGPIPDIANVRRRTKCRKSLLAFGLTYIPEAFDKPCCPDQLRGIARLEEAAQLGARYAFAWPRGGGKTAWCRAAALWAISYGLCHYVYLIGANQGKADANLQALKIWMRFLPLYAADFPEICHAVKALRGIANRASGQTCGDASTQIEWGKSEIVLPTVPLPGNWPKSWPRRGDGQAPTSGSIVAASGLTGEGIRGSLLTLTTGAMIRPDLVLLDDPQTPESARHPAQNATREQLVAADVLGMAGPGKTISAVMPCTVIAPGDMVDCLLDRAKHPLWRGERTRILRSMPTCLERWDPYFELYHRDAQREPPDYTRSAAYYREHQAELEEGAEASWPERLLAPDKARKFAGDVSAVQHAMHLYDQDQRAFFSEYQNDPLPLVAPLTGELVADEVAARCNRFARGTAPGWAQRLTAFIDVQGELLYWVACAWGEGFSGAVLDYGAWPDQRRDYYTLRQANPTLAAATGVTSLEGSLHAGLGRLTAELLGREWPVEGAPGLRIERCLVDSGWGYSTLVVRRFCRGSPHAPVLLPSKGMPIGAAHVPMEDWPRKEGERRGDQWLVRLPAPGQTSRLILFDANAWKDFLRQRLRQPLGETGALTLFGADPRAHRLLADHCTSEYRVETSGRGRQLQAWLLRPGDENHLWDALVGCCVAASERGTILAGLPPAPKRQATQVSYAAQQAAARARR